MMRVGMTTKLAAAAAAAAAVGGGAAAAAAAAFVCYLNVVENHQTRCVVVGKLHVSVITRTADML
jgi:hypothetical protein